MSANGGRVCSIKEGAVLIADDPGIQYGGTVVDWSEADVPNADQIFWLQEEPEIVNSPLRGEWKVCPYSLNNVKVRVV